VRRAALAAALGLVAAPLTAYPRPHPELPGEREPARQAATTGYTLALIWMPEQCHSTNGEGVEPRAAGECADPAIRAGFTLHGLWPDGAGYDQWPQYCRPVAILTAREIAAGYRVTPSAQLLQHEWAKHGVCVAPSAGAYFAEERRLFGALHVPDMAALAARRDLTAIDIQRAVSAANPGMTPDMMRLEVNRSGWLKEIWLCLGLDRRSRVCPDHAGGATPDQPVRVQAPA
jgi:ribonuclease T2